MPAPSPGPAGGPALRVDALAFRYPGAGFGVRVDSLTLAPGEQVLLTGGSGSGKSTILHLIAGLIEPDAGHVFVNSTEINRLRAGARDHFRGRHIGMIFQTFNLLQGFSAVENVLVALMFSDLPRAQHRPRALELLASLGVERAYAPIDQLSVGQQQRVAVARAVACSPALVLADEPTASLDPQNADEAMTVIQQSCRACNAALLCVSHDPSLVSRFERRMTMPQLATTSSGAAGGSSTDASVSPVRVASGGGAA